MFRYAAKHKKRLLVVAGAAGGVAIVGIDYFEKKQTASPKEKQQLRIASPKIIPPKGIPTRAEQVARLSGGKEYDVLVIGGGATGCGAALDAQMRGLSTALIERGDFSSETSSRSTKLLWAGVRYIATSLSELLRLRNLTRPKDAINDFWSEFKMVMGAHKERKILLEMNPHLTNWVPIAIPMKTWVVWPPPFGHPMFSLSPLLMPAVFKFYDSLSGFTCPPSHIMRKSRAKRKFPQLDEDIKYVSVFYEGQHNDARTATCIALTAAEEGATVTNYVEMIDIIRENGDKGKAVGIIAKDKMSGKEFEIRAKAIVFAGGPFTDGLRKLEEPNCKPAVSGASGTHIVLPGYYSPDGIGLLDINTSDGRFLFFLPWEGSTLVGTTDRKGNAVSSPGPPEDDIKYLLNECEKYLSSDLQVRRADVLSAWQGYRPLASDPNAPPGAPVSRDHVISTNPDTGITFITGGKWTTYREMAEDVIDRVVEQKSLPAGPCVTDKRPLRGGVGYSRNVPVQLVQQFGVSEEVAEHLARTYGMNAFDVCSLAQPTDKLWPRFGRALAEGYPFLECEIEWACKNEMVVTVKDMLTLRTRLAYLNTEVAERVAPKVADLMGKALGWSTAEKEHHLTEAMSCLAEFGGPIPKQEGATLSTATENDRQTLFNTFDQDHNGYIDFVEMKLVAKHLGSDLTEQQAKQTFETMDANGNGRITEEQFFQWWNTAGPDDKLRNHLVDRMKLSAAKLGEGPGSRGVAFG